MTRRNTLALFRSIAAAVVLGAAALPLSAAHAGGAMADPMVGGAAMYPTKTIVDNAVNSKDHTTLVAAVKAAGLVGALEGPGPFTVFAPTNEAFGKLPASAVQDLMQPQNKAQLTSVLTYHVVSGRYTARDLMDLVRSGGGQARLTTLQGEPLMVMQKGSMLVVTDSKGDAADVTIADVIQSNGVIHVVDTVLMP
jgi:uncharacterized surface protein with fasciclin (FAS1) repeats